MPLAPFNPGCPYLDELIVLLDEEAETRDCSHRPQLIEAMRELELRAGLCGASTMTLALISLSRKKVRASEMRRPRRTRSPLPVLGMFKVH